ncbi:hypothetical protein E1A91_A12G142800v1 [Gossypium mustelinum]|uniref:G-patch domain-containing protein n=1 Tax=Gossypium mustelinum TaxID=34275 RepID=A0A5D2WU82_GOSMU|nr:hypothetical protein E1A91_A12G142800v1 [Gossypium mustelinum]
MGEALGSSTAIDSSNIGFQLLKKHGWKEGTGLGVSEQGRLEPVQAYVKNNKKGLGAEKKRKNPKPSDPPDSKPKNDEETENNKEDQGTFQKDAEDARTRKANAREGI